MPSVHVIVLDKVSSGTKKKIDNLIREEICRAARKLGESEKIPDPHIDFSVVIGEGLTCSGVTIEISMMLFPRDQKKQEIYKQALENAVHRAGFDSVLGRVHSASPEDWRN